MSPLTLHDSAALRQSKQDRIADLAADVTAAAIRPGPSVDIYAVHTRPAILRRLAALLAEYLPQGVDRLVATDSDACLVTAVALHSGVPFVLAGTESGDSIVFHGDLYPSERLALVETVPSRWRESIIGELQAVHNELAVVGTAIHTGPRTPRRGGVDNRCVYRLSEDGLEPFQEDQ